MKRYVEASAKARWIFSFAALFWAGAVFFLSRLDAWFPMSSILREQLVQGLDRSVVFIVVLAVFYLMLSAFAVFYAVKTVRSRQWPPAGTVPVRMPVIKVKNRVVVWVIAATILSFGAAHIGAKVYAWKQDYRLVQELMPLLNAPKQALKKN